MLKGEMNLTEVEEIREVVYYTNRYNDKSHGLEKSTVNMVYKAIITAIIEYAEVAAALGHNPLVRRDDLRWELVEADPLGQLSNVDGSRVASIDRVVSIVHGTAARVVAKLTGISEDRLHGIEGEDTL